MKKFPLWKHCVVLMTVLLGVFYAIPNIYSIVPVLKIACSQSTDLLNLDLTKKIQQFLNAECIQTHGVFIEKDKLLGNVITLRFKNTDFQEKSKILFQNNLAKLLDNSHYSLTESSEIALPIWTRKLGWFQPKPLVLGLDLRGGTYFVLKIDISEVLSNFYSNILTNICSNVFHNHEKNPSFSIDRSASGITLKLLTSNFQDCHDKLSKLRRLFPEIKWSINESDNLFKIFGKITDNAKHSLQKRSIDQNLKLLNKQVNELGLSEPIIQQQGDDKIIVQLPGMQEINKAKELLGRTANLEIRLIEDTILPGYDKNPTFINTINSEKLYDRNGLPFLVQNQVLLTGKNIKDAQPGRDSLSNKPVVNLILDLQGTRTFQNITRNNINKRLAIILVEKGKGEILTTPIIRHEIASSLVQISGLISFKEAVELSFLLRTGSLAAPMTIIEENTIGPSLSLENANKGFQSTIYGFLAIILLMTIYYHLFGLFAVIGLTINLILLIALLSILQATLTLPGIAAVALTLGMSIDSNVLINERIREEIRHGRNPYNAIIQGFNRAWNTIIDSNCTMLIVGFSLLVFSSGPIRGFAIVHSLGILTSMFSSTMVVRSLVSLWYHNPKIQKIAIGTIWKDQQLTQ